MKHVLWVILIMSLSMVVASAQIKECDIRWTKNGQAQYLYPGVAGQTYTIERDPGTAVSFSVWPTSAAPSPRIYYLADVSNGILVNSGSTTQGYWYFDSKVGSAATQVWLYVTDLQSKITININNNVPTQPDLTVTSITFDGSTQLGNYQSNQTVAISCRVDNNGSSTAASSYLGIYLGTSSSDYSNRIGSKSVSQLSGLTGTFVSYNYTFKDADAGTKYLLFKADYTNVVAESDENNNTAYRGPFQVTVVPPQAPTANAATGMTQTSFAANWNSVSGATGYRLDVSTNSSFSSFVAGFHNLDVGNTTSSSVTGLSAATPFYYQVRAYNAGGTSGNSNSITATTLSNVTISGTLSWATDPFRNIGGLVVRATNISDNSKVYDSRTSDYQTGAYSITNVPNGTYNMSIKDALPGEYTLGGSTSVTVSGADLTGKNLTLTGNAMPTVRVTGLPTSFTPGQSFTFRAYVKNSNASLSVATASAYLDVSFPDDPSVTIGTKSSEWGSTGVNLYSPTQPAPYNTIYTKSGGTLTQFNKLVSAGKQGIQANTEYYVEMTLTPPTTASYSNLRIRYRGTIGDKVDPASGTNVDQQGWAVYEATIPQVSILIPPSWGDGVVVSPAGGYVIGNKQFTLKSYLGGTNYLVFDGTVLVRDKKTIEAVVAYHSLFVNSLGLDDPASASSSWQQVGENYKKIITEIDPEKYRQELKNQAFQKLLTMTGATLGGFTATALIAAATGVAAPAAPFIEAGGVIAATAVAIKGVGDVFAVSARALAVDNFSAVERYNYLRAEAFLDGEDAEMKDAATISNMNTMAQRFDAVAQGSTGVGQALSTINNIYKVVRTVQDVTNAPSTIASLTLSFMAQEFNKTVDYQIDVENNEYLLQVSVYQHQQMLIRLSAQIAKTYDRIPSSNDPSDAIECMGELPILLDLYYLVYEEGLYSQTTRAAKLPNSGSKVYDFKYLPQDLNPLSQEQSATTSFRQGVEAKISSYALLVQATQDNASKSYVALGVLLDDQNVFVQNFGASVIPSIVPGRTSTQSLSIKNLKSAAATITSVVPVSSDLYSTVISSFPATIAAGGIGTISLSVGTATNIDWNRTNSSNPVFIQIQGSVGSDQFLQVVDLNESIRPETALKDIALTKGVATIGEQVPMTIFVSSLVTAQVSVYAISRTGAEYLVANLTVQPTDTQVGLTWTVPSTVPKGAYSMEGRLSTGLKFRFSRVLRVLPQFTADMSQFNFTNTTIVTSAVDDTIAQRISKALGNASILYTQSLTSAQLLQAMEQNNLLLIGGYLSNPLVDDLIYRGKLPSNLWVNAGDANINLVNDPFTPIAPSGYQAIIVAGYQMEDTFIAGLKLLEILDTQQPTSPTVSVSLSTLADFGTVLVGAKSSSKYYSVSGSNLTADITANAPTGFEISADNTTFGGSITLPRSGKTVSPTSLYVRFSPTAVGQQSGNIVHSSAGATSKSVQVSGTGQSIITQWHTLSPGWNIISAYVTPTNADMLQLMQQLIQAGTLIKVQDENGNAIENLPGIGWVNNIGGWESPKGYYLKITSATDFGVTGLQTQLPLSIPLAVGWHIITYPRSIQMNALTALQPLIASGKLVKVQDERGNAIENLPGIGWINNIVNFTPGHGYYLKVNAAGSLAYNADGSTSKMAGSTIASTESRHFKPAYKGNPYSPMNLYLQMPLGASALGTFEIGVFDNDLCVGSGGLAVDSLSHSMIPVVAGMDDPMTSEIDGYCNGHSIGIKMWDGLREISVPVSVLPCSDGDSPSMTFNQRGTLVLKVLSSVLQGMADLSKPTLLESYPNPFNPSTTLTYFVTSPAPVSLVIYNVLGQKVKILESSQMTAGYHTVVWDGSDRDGRQVSTGIYLVRFEAQGISVTKKLLLAK